MLAPECKIAPQFCLAQVLLGMTAMMGCYFSGPVVVDPPGMTSTSTALFSPTAQRMRERKAPRRSAASLPSDLRPVQGERAWRYIVLHHSATPDGDVDSIHAAHRQRKDRAGRPWLGIGYHFVIGNGQGMPDGLIEPTFRWRKQIQGAHAGVAQYNEAGIGICLIGNFQEQPPTPRQLRASRELVELLASRYEVPKHNILRHGSLAPTECPGRHFHLSELISREETPYESP